MTNVNSNYRPEQQTIRASIKPTLIFLVVLWAIKIFETQFNTSLHFLGMYPMSLEGIHGILTGPLIHGSFEHLASNSLSLLILVTALFFGYPNSALKTVSIVWLGSGLGTWLFARDAWHFGASGLTHGLFFFLLLASILRKDKRSVALMMIAFFMYGGMLMSIFPREVNISFEYHLFGAISGGIAAILFRHADPKLAEKVYDWESDKIAGDETNGQVLENSSASDLIGDQWQLDVPQDSPPSMETTDDAEIEAGTTSTSDANAHNSRFSPYSPSTESDTRANDHKPQRTLD